MRAPRPVGTRGGVGRDTPALLWAALVTAVLAAATPSLTEAASTVPWECSNYSEEAQARCMQALIETQRERIGQLEGELKAHQNAVGQLREQVDRQSAATADLQRQLATPPPVGQTVPPVYAYPPASVGIYPGFGLYLGRPWRYGYGYGYGLSFGYRPYVGFGGYRYGGPCYRHWRWC